MLIALLGGCGGSALPNGSVVNSPGGPTQSPPPLVSVKVTVTVPPRTKNHGVNPNYVSVNTESLVVQLASVNGQGVSGVNPTTINTLARSHDCKSGSGGTVCSATTQGSPGEDVFAVSAYDGTNATGAVLSVGTVQAKISGGGGGVQVSNRLSLTLYGVIAGITLAVAPNGAKRGVPSKAAVTLNAYDASGAQIVGPSKFATAMSLAIQGDAQNAFLLHVDGKSGTSFSILRPTSKIELSYDGNAQASSITLAASVDGPGSNNASAPFKLHGKQPPPPVGTIYALNLGANDGVNATVTEYDGKSSGNAAPKRTLQLSSKLYARSIAVDSNNNLYVGYFDNQFGFSPSNGQPDKGNEIAIYPAGASGNQQPSAVIIADKSTNTTIFPLYMAFDPGGNLVTYGATGINGINGSDAIIAYAPSSQGPAVPTYAWAFVSPLITYAGPTGLALDSAGNFYVNGALHTSLGPDYGLFVALASDKNNPAVTPSRTIPWTGITQLTPGLTTGDAIDESGEPFVATKITQGSGSHTSCQGVANVYSAGPNGGTTDVKPIRTLTLGGVFTQNPLCVAYSNPLAPFFPSISLYGTLLFVADDFNNAIDAYKASDNGNVKSSLQITGSATQLNAPIALVVTSVSGQAKARPAHPLLHSIPKEDSSK
ncbi:MAG TPA: hypothetical protein VEW74_06280 [Candidatus Nitrosotalea sp.]|nr:hypothetical protein [Candidatus Nitrosotalea sp.]